MNIEKRVIERYYYAAQNGKRLEYFVKDLEMAGELVSLFNRKPLGYTGVGGGGIKLMDGSIVSKNVYKEMIAKFIKRKYPGQGVSRVSSLILEHLNFHTPLGILMELNFAPNPGPYDKLAKLVVSAWEYFYE